MKNSYRFYTNHECEYYPCHEGIQDMNCMFCYCPLYQEPHCYGKPAYILYQGHRIKDCSACLFPHQPENYERIISWLTKKNQEGEGQ